MTDSRRSSTVGTLNEGPLHQCLKDWYTQDGDRQEVPVDGRRIDIVRGDLLIEIQTSRLGAIRTKLEGLLGDHRVRLVHPVARDMWIVKVDDDRRVIGRRRSPARRTVIDAFRELVGLAGLFAHPSFSCEVLLTQQEELRRLEPGRAWRRRGWVVVERRLLDVVDSHEFSDPSDLLCTLPVDLPTNFTTADLVEGLDITPGLAQKMAYCLRMCGAIELVGKRGKANLYTTQRAS